MEYTTLLFPFMNNLSGTCNSSNWDLPLYALDGERSMAKCRKVKPKAKMVWCYREKQIYCFSLRYSI